VGVHAAGRHLFDGTTILGNGLAGYSDDQVNNPYGLAIGPDGALYFCDLDNQRIRRFDLKTKGITTIAGNGKRGYAGDGGPASKASLNMPHEVRFDSKGDLFIAERDNHVIRKVDMRTGVISTVAVRARQALTAMEDRAQRRGCANRTASSSIGTAVF